jgi:hypothetical protein
MAIFSEVHCYLLVVKAAAEPFAGFQITIRTIDEKNKRTVCRGSLAREGGSLESYWRPAPREFKSPPRRQNGENLSSLPIQIPLKQVFSIAPYTNIQILIGTKNGPYV